MFQFLGRTILVMLVSTAHLYEPSVAQEQTGISAGTNEALLGDALATLFSPRHAPAQKSMGLLQRNFLDLADESRGKLEIAFVIDGTESMGDQLKSVRTSIVALMQDLELYKEAKIGYQVVVYRDSGSPSGEIQFPLQQTNNSFVYDRESITNAIESVQAESGAPYFLELPDQGVQSALADLPWSTDDNTSRWIFLIGDAPPYSESFDEPKFLARRRVGTQKLISLAAQQQVKINCILCQSRAQDLEAYRGVLGQTRRFMSTLSTETKGLMLDLSYQDIRNAIRSTAPRATTEYQRVGKIDIQEIVAARQAINKTSVVTSEKRRVLLAVLPHFPLDEMAFEPDLAGVQLATELRFRLREAPEVDFKDPVTVRDRFELLSRRGLRGEALLQMLARALNVDYVLWGTVEPNGTTVVAKTGIYERATGKRVLEVRIPSNATTKPDEFGMILAERLVSSELSLAMSDRRLQQAFASLANADNVRSELLVPVALGGAKSSLLAGMESLEQAIAYPVGAPEAVQLLQKARKHLTEALAANDESILARYLLANCCYNEARNLKLQQDVDGARQRVQEFAKHLREALNAGSNRTVDASLKAELEADYALLIQRDTEKAVRGYQGLLENQTGFDMSATRRAYWMLAGIYSGDWGVDKKFVNPEKLKDCFVQILAIWPDSSEAQFIKQVLRWDDEEKQTRFHYFPRENADWENLSL